MQIKYLNVPLNIKSVSDTGEFEGYASVFDVVDSYGDVVVKGAFKSTLESWSKRNDLPPVLWQHKMSEPIGPFTEMKEDDHGLFVRGKLLIEEDPLAKRAHAHMKAGSVKGMSIGYMVVDAEYHKQEDLYYLKEIDLWEVSIVTFPANTDAKITEVKTALQKGDIPSPTTVEKALRDVMGFSRKQAKAFMAKGYCALDSQRDAESQDEALQSFKDLTAFLRG
ncbi:HK97 family phage prohead protease [Acinetobacter chinensis]|uniref:HK97 family phage prohead protease n=1 Tax=Acinetobacter chinensis TaxID=2004650 RepID=A0A3B7LXA8_9GAMM|nr:MULTISPECIES: HK97 family phage prohead protease [Acinetobacter]AXY56635.1 HK97 family phage prohead protease [Acinetobacter chinensis]AXY60019.1 HK97 family phage prohead protease [Acinetobacter sp. WCHAc010052]MDV2468322.1 HK97 family phage prohead protease [Acinetobacter chinensis]